MESESVAEDIPGAGDIHGQLFDNPRNIYPDRDAAELTDIQAQDLLQYHCPGSCDINTAGSLAVQAYPVYHRRFPRLCPRDDGGHAADFEPGAAVWVDPGDPVARAVQRSHAGHCRIELFAGLADLIAGKRTHMAAGADAGRAGCAEVVDPPLPVYAVSAQAGNTVSAAGSPIPGETSRTGPYRWGSAQSGP